MLLDNIVWNVAPGTLPSNSVTAELVTSVVPSVLIQINIT